MTTALPVTFDDVRDAATRRKGIAHRTPVLLVVRDPEQFRALTGSLPASVSAVTDHEVYHGAQQLIPAADSTSASVPSPAPGTSGHRTRN
ncbi:hypothetical protein [Streptomyces sp. NRRL B-24720]|uniref:hypothetical protein n=1 Tax=Streptomyces sp. NRRL B-24720 TaxID=1476876 RepID=UPI0004C7C3FC|nr:hypothetical protein [Streptomyces sp. NRRL B-24720]